MLGTLLLLFAFIHAISQSTFLNYKSASKLLHYALYTP